VDDGSTDGTSSILKNYSRENNVSYARISQNVGKSNAIAHGMNIAFKKISDIGWIGFLDSDGAFSTADVENIINKTNMLKKYDAIYSSRVKMSGRNVKRNNIRHVIARIITSIYGLVWKDIPYDTQSGFKLYKYKYCFNVLFKEKFKTKWFFDIELSTRILNCNNGNFKVWEEPVSSWIDIPGSKINYRQSLKILLELIYVFCLIIRQQKKLSKIN